jgi:hypothetical protein
MEMVEKKWKEDQNDLRKAETKITQLEFLLGFFFLLLFFFLLII